MEAQAKGAQKRQPPRGKGKSKKAGAMPSEPIAGVRDFPPG